MKVHLFRFFVVMALVRALVLPAGAQSCAIGKTLTPIELAFSWREGTTTLIGFSEYVASAPPKKYLKKQVTGTVTVGQFGTSDCINPTHPNSFEDSASDFFPAGYYIPEGQPGLAWSAKLILVGSVTGSDGLPRNRYRAETSCNKPDVTIIVGANTGNIFTTWYNGEEHDLYPNAVYGVAAGLPAGAAFALGSTAKAMQTAPIPQTKDEWNFTRLYDKNDRTGVAFTDTDSSIQSTASSLSFPFAGTGEVSLSPPSAAYGSMVSQSLAPTSKTLVGTSSCIPVSSSSYAKATGSYLETLSIEDTEANAEARAVVTEDASTTRNGPGPAAFRTSRGTGFSYGFRTVKYTAKFDISCPGNYDIYVNYTVKAHDGSGTETSHQLVVSRQLESGIQSITGTIEPKAKDLDYTIQSVEARAGCSGAHAGSGSFDIGSIRARFNLGFMSGGLTAGSLTVDAEGITSGLFTPAMLRAAVPEDPAVEPIYVSDVVRQVKAPQALADVITLNSTSYEIRFYASSQVGAQDPGSKIYAVTGTPYATFKVESSNSGSGFKITETRGSATNVTEYLLSGATWTLSLGGDLRRESEVTTTVAGNTVKTKTVKNSADQVVSKIARTYHTYAWGQELIKEVIDPDTAALTTDYEFYDSVATSDPNYSRLKQRTEANGGWERLTYHASGKVLKSIRPFLNAAPTTTDEALCRVVENTYDTVADADGDSVAEARTTTVERTLGQETRRTYQIVYTKSVTIGTDACTVQADIVCVAAGAAWNASGNLVTQSLLLSGGPYAGRTRRIVNPDGTATLTAYSLASNGTLTATTQTGQPNSAFDAIVDGTRIVRFTSALGQVTSETTTDIASSLTLSSWTATELDTIGRPTRIDYDDGTYITRSYACCGLASERDRTGLTTTYTYDSLGRQTSMTRQGITTQTTYDAAGNVKTVVRVGTDASTITQQTNIFNVAGRLIERRDALNRATTFADTYNSSTGETTRTTTQPDGGTIIEVTARDGSRTSVSGTAAAPHVYDYGIDSTGVYVKDIDVGADATGAPTTTEWTKSYTDLAGRSFKTVYADSASAQSFFNTAGHLIREVDPDGITMLYAYNARGEQNVAAVDMNGNNAIDYAGIDRIAKTTSSVATKTDGSAIYTVLKTETQVWEADGVDAPTTVSTSEQSIDGLRTWQTVRGLVTKSALVLDGSGGRTATTTAADGSKTVQVYTAGRLTSTTRKTAADVQLGATTLAYDAHGRLQSSTDARNGTSAFTYYADDQVNTATTPDPDATLSGGGYDAQTTTTTYDSAGRVHMVTQADGGVVTTTYWPTGAVKRTSGVRTYPAEYTYDQKGRLKTLTTWQNFAGDSGKAVTIWNYDSSRGWLLNKRYADGTGPAYTYKPSGRLLTRVWARSPTITTTYGYNAAGDLTGSDYSDATTDVSMAYDRSGRVVTVTDASGTRTLSYHASGQLQNETYIVGLLNGIAVNRTFDDMLRRSTLTVPSVVSASYEYDDASRLHSVTTGASTATYAYTANSPFIASVIFASGGVTRLTTAKAYDKLNRLISIVNTPSAAAVSHAYAYDTANQRTRATREDGTYWSYGYDALGQVIGGNKFLADGTAALGLAYGYTYDDIGNRKATQVNGQTATYAATTLNQYSQRTVPGVLNVTGAANTSATVTVAVDGGAPQTTSRQGETFHKQVAVDNSSAAQYPVLKITGVKNLAGPNGEDVVAQATQSAHLAKTPEVFAYDIDGNLTDDARWHYTWDGENRLIVIETSTSAATAGVPRQKLEFTYDAQGRRVEKKVSTWNAATGSYQFASDTRFVYDGWTLLADLNGSSGNAVVCTYVWGLDLGGSLQDAGGVGGLVFSTLAGQTGNYAYGYDGNGNVSSLVEMGAGAQAATYDYNASGEAVASDGAIANANAFRFSTKYIDGETGFIYYGVRYFQPNIGRWISRDPMEERGGENVFGFLGNVTTTKIDAVGYLGFEVLMPKFAEVIKVLPETVKPRPVYPLPPPVPLTGPSPQGAQIQRYWRLQGEENVNPDEWLYRSMSGDLQPDVGESATKLGVRTGMASLGGVDVVIVDGTVSTWNPGGVIQGMSTSPRSPALLPEFRRPKEFGGTSNKPAWAIRRSSVLRDPKLLINDDSPTHSTIAPGKCMPYPSYRDALEATRPLWRRVIVFTYNNNDIT